MKRLHVHVAVDDLNAIDRFYSALFAAEPSVIKTGLRQVDARRSARQFRHLDARRGRPASIISASRPRTATN